MSRKKEHQLLGELQEANINNRELRQTVYHQSKKIVTMRKRELVHGKILLFLAALLTLSLITNLYLIFR